MRIAILEDDPDQSELVTLWLEDAGYSVTCCETSSAFLKLVRHESFDLYLLDWVVPTMSGVEVLAKVRLELGDNTPAMVATVKDRESDVVLALESGADDFLVKPIRRAELLARMAAILRRSGFGDTKEQTVIEARPYHFNLTKQIVLLRGTSIQLTHREFALAAFLFRNPSKLLSRNHILEVIWGIDSEDVSTRTVDTHISRLRKKLDLG